MVKIANVYDALVEVVYNAMRQVHQDHEMIAGEGPNFLDCYAQGTVAEILMSWQQLRQHCGRRWLG